MNYLNTKQINRANLYKNTTWIVIILLFAIITGIAIADTKWIYFGAVLIPLLLYLCVEKPFIFPFGLYVLLIPFDPILSMTGIATGATLTKLLGILTILVLLLKISFENKLKQPDTTVIWWVLFTFFGILSISWAIQPERVLSVIPTFVGLLILYLVVSLYEIQKSEFTTLKWCILVGGFLAAVYTIYSFNTVRSSLETTFRATMTFGERSTNANFFAFTLLIPLSVCIEMMLKQNKKVIRVLFGVVLAVMFFCIIITGSRGVFLGAAVVLIVYILSKKQKITFGIISIVIGIILMPFIPDLFVERWGQAIETGGTGRLDIWYVGWKALEKYWPIGAGLNNFRSAHIEFVHYSGLPLWGGRAPHNIFLGFFVELGVVGITLMVLAMMKHYKLLQLQFTKNNIDIIMLKASFWAVLVSSLFLDSVWLKSFWLLWMMIMMHKNVVKREV